MSALLVLVLGLGLDALLGEMRRGHPLVAFGRLADGLERRLWRDHRAAGMAAWLLAVLPWVVLAWWFERWLGRLSPWLVVAFDGLALYWAVGARSLVEHARAVAAALRTGDLDASRRAVGRIVGRDVDVLDADGVAVAATESTLENGGDGVFSALFWVLLLGAPGVVLYRLANTLDAMWGHPDERHARFGWMAARCDDVLNYLPARLVAWTYALCGNFEGARRAWREQAHRWISPNAGPVMAAGAGALGVQLGGWAAYRGDWIDRPPLGAGDAPDADSVVAAIRLLRRGVFLWLLVAALVAVTLGVAHA